MIKNLLPYIPAHHTYAEVCGGTAALLLAKRPAPVEVYNDVNAGLVNFYRVVRHRQKSFELQDMLKATPYSRREWLDAKALYKTAPGDVERAYYFFIVARQSFGGKFGDTWGYNVEKSSRGMASCVSSWHTCIGRIQDVRERLWRVQFEEDDFSNVIRRYDTSRTFFYIDPPYNIDVRDGGAFFEHELDKAGHIRLVESVIRIKGKALISGYHNELYAPLCEGKWRRIDIVSPRTITTRVSSETGEDVGERVESIYLNYEP